MEVGHSPLTNFIFSLGVIYYIRLDFIGIFLKQLFGNTPWDIERAFTVLVIF